MAVSVEDGWRSTCPGPALDSVTRQTLRADTCAPPPAEPYLSSGPRGGNQGVSKDYTTQLLLALLLPLFTKINQLRATRARGPDTCRCVVGQRENFL